jgi:hypothetical protein
MENDFAVFSNFDFPNFIVVVVFEREMLNKKKARKIMTPYILKLC